jgi:hypothetical protein
MKEETKKLLREIQANPSSGVSHDAKMTLVQVEEIFALDELTEEVKELKRNLVEYNAVAKKENQWTRILTIILGFLTLLNLIVLIKQTNLVEEQSISERINQKRSIQEAIEFCNQNKESEESGLFEISTGKPASCEEVLSEYGDDNSIWSRIKRLF